MNTNNAQKSLIQAINDLVGPIEFALQSDGNTRIFFKALGWDFDRIENFPFNDLTTSLGNINSLIETIRNIIISPPQTLQELSTVLNTFENLFASINSFTNFISSFSNGGLTASFKTEFTKLGSDVINYLVCGYLESHYFKLYATLSVLGIVSPYQAVGITPSVSETDETWVRLPYYRSSIHLENIVALIDNPVGYFKAQFYPASGQLNTAAEAQEFSDNFFPRLELLFQSLGFDTYYSIDKERASRYTADAASVLKRTLTVIHHAPNFINYGATLCISPTNEGGHGLVIRLFGDWTYNRKIEEWLLIIKASASIDVFAINSTGIHFPASFSSADFGILIQLLRLNTDQNLVGSTTGTRFRIGKASVSALMNYRAERISYGFELLMNKVQFFIGGEGDGFINKIIPNGAGGEFDLSIGWDNISGLHMNAGGGLEFNFPIHQKVGPVDFESVTLGIYVDNGALSIRGGGSLSLEIGPLIAKVENVGIKANLSFPASGGNLGVGNLEVGFKSPTGVGISIDSDQVKGGGFLSYNEAEATYTGALEVKISQISLKAIGILTTKLPGNEDGYSLLLLITADGFTPIQLGLGFTLNGVGGLLALNRTTNVDYLSKGLQNNRLESILFPQNIVQNAGAIISNLNGAFPIKKDRFLVGPMFKIGWGTPPPLPNSPPNTPLIPPVLTIDLGVFIELPSPIQLLILGVLRAVLPDEKNPVLRLQVNFQGRIDFDKKALAFDADLYNSKILTFALTGTMAVRLFWGDNPRFLVTAGGFHPNFKPPPMDLPDLRRLSISLVDTKNLRINAEAYFAITSNSAQFGAKLKLWAKASRATAEGEIGVDMLFQFSPFSFIGSAGAHFSIKWNGKEKLSVHVTLQIEGPNSWRVQGKASFEICFIDVTVRFDRTFGKVSTELVAPISLWPTVKAAINHKDNWIVEGPERIQPVVSYREVTLLPGQLLVDPFGGLRLSQKAAPLDVTLQKYSTAAINDFDHFSIGQVASSGTSLLTSPVKDYFARGEFFHLSDTEKLIQGSYELFNSGVRIGNTDDLFSNFFTLRAIAFEDKIIDSRYRAFRFGKSYLTLAEMQKHLYGDYVSVSPLSDFKEVTPLGGPSKTTITSIEDVFVLVDRDTLIEVPSSATYSAASYSSYQQAQEQLALLQGSGPAMAASYIIVNAFEL